MPSWVEQASWLKPRASLSVRIRRPMARLISVSMSRRFALWAVSAAASSGMADAGVTGPGGAVVG